jgi:hypothetical protein
MNRKRHHGFHRWESGRHLQARKGTGIGRLQIQAVLSQMKNFFDEFLHLVSRQEVLLDAPRAEEPKRVY